MGDIDRDAYGLVPVALREWLGYAWVCLAGQPPSFEDAVVGAVTARLGDPGAIRAYGLDDLALGKRITYNVAANWKLIVENFMECYHCARSPGADRRPARVRGRLRCSVLRRAWRGLRRPRGRVHHRRQRGLRAPAWRDRRPGPPVLRGHHPAQVFINLVPDHVILHRMIPLDPERTTIVCDWLFHASVVASGQDVSRSVELFDRVNQQDFAACERTQPSMSSRAYRDGGVLVPSEHHIGDFHSWVRDLISEVPGSASHQNEAR